MSRKSLIEKTMFCKKKVAHRSMTGQNILHHQLCLLEKVGFELDIPLRENGWIDSLIIFQSIKTKPLPKNSSAMRRDLGFASIGSPEPQ